jgi:hypothetical protein
LNPYSPFFPRFLSNSPPGAFYAAQTGMLIAALIFLGSSAALVILSLIVMSFAPQGYEDEAGFHLGPEKSSHPQEGYSIALAEAKAVA